MLGDLKIPIEICFAFLFCSIPFLQSSMQINSGITNELQVGQQSFMFSWVILVHDNKLGGPVKF